MRSQEKQINMRLDEKLKTKIEEQAKLQNLTITEYLRNAVIEKIESDKSTTLDLKNSIIKLSEIDFDAIFKSVNKLEQKVLMLENIALEHRKFFKETYKSARIGVNISLKLFNDKFGDDEASKLLNYELDKANKYIDENSDF